MPHIAEILVEGRLTDTPSAHGIIKRFMKAVNCDQLLIKGGMLTKCDNDAYISVSHSVEYDGIESCMTCTKNTLVIYDFITTIKQNHHKNNVEYVSAENHVLIMANFTTNFCKIRLSIREPHMSSMDYKLVRNNQLYNRCTNVPSLSLAEFITMTKPLYIYHNDDDVLFLEYHDIIPILTSYSTDDNDIDDTDDIIIDI